MTNVLLLDDEDGFRNDLVSTLETDGYKVFATANTEEAENILTQIQIDILLLDLCLEGGNNTTPGLNFIDVARRINPNTQIIILTAFDTESEATRAIEERKAHRFLGKGDLDALFSLLNEVTEEIELDKLVEGNKGFSYGPEAGNIIIGVSLQMKAVFKQIKQLAKRDIDLITIRGETGTGKELIAEAINYHKSLTDSQETPFLPVDCGAISPMLFETEFFGVEKKSVTGIDGKPGKFEIANPGTLFLDEIGNLDQEHQEKFLRILESREVTRIGGKKPDKLDLLILCATDRPLEELVKNRQFNVGLYYRIMGTVVHLPLLKERKEDILPLAEYFVEKYAKKHNSMVNTISTQAQEVLKEYDWPGNVRNLERVIEVAVMYAQSKFLLPSNVRKAIDSYHEEQVNTAPLQELPDRGIDLKKKLKEHEVTRLPFQELPDKGIDLKKELKEHEVTRIRQALEKADGVQADAARLLGMRKTTFNMRMRALKLRGKNVTDPKF